MSSNKEKTLYVHASGAVTSLGWSLPATCAAIRAGVDNFQQSDFIGNDNEPLIVARVARPEEKELDGLYYGGLKPYITWLDRVIDECLQQSPLSENTPVRLILLCADRRLSSAVPVHTLHASFQQGFEKRSVLSPGKLSIQTYQTSAPGFSFALEHAREYLAKKENGACLIAAVDSWLNYPRLHDAMRSNRLLDGSNPNGLIPGEAASAVLLRAHAEERAGLQVIGVGHGSEEATLADEEQPCFGVGLANAIREALGMAGIDAHQVSLRLHNRNGEEYFDNEATYAWSRILRQSLPKGNQHETIASKTGDIGTAFGPLLIGYALHIHNAQRHPGEYTLITLSGEHKHRSALVLRRI